MLILKDSIEITEMADRFWKSMPSALKKPTLDGLYRRLRDLDYTQVDERMAVMLNAILQLEEQGECRESATEAVFDGKATPMMECPIKNKPDGCPGTWMGR